MFVLQTEYIVVYTRLHAFKNAVLSKENLKKIAAFSVKEGLFKPYNISLEELKSKNVQILSRFMVRKEVDYNGPKENTTISIQTTFTFADPDSIAWIKTKIV